jgi:hypothetical protein
MKIDRHRNWWRFMWLASLLALLPGLAQAAPLAPQGALRPGWTARLWAALPQPGTGPHFLYLDNGGVIPSDSLSGYQLTPTGLVPTPGS